MLEAVSKIEALTNLPVTTSNHAMAWHCLRLAGSNKELTQFGSLFGKTLVDSLVQ